MGGIHPLYVIVPAILAILGFIFFKLKDRIDGRRMCAMHVATKLREYGLVHLPELLELYAVGDYVGFMHKLYTLSKMLLVNDTVLEQEFKTVYDRVMAKKLATPEGRTLVAAQLAAAASKS